MVCRFLVIVKRMLMALRPAKIRGFFQSFHLRLVAMRYDLPPLLALQAFEAAARHENFAAAAQELKLSQSAVSHRVRALERHLGYPLFERLPRGLRLTESAKAYVPSLRRAFEDILGSTSGVFGSRGESVLIVRAPVSYTSLRLSTVIDRFLATYPQIEISSQVRFGPINWPPARRSLMNRHVCPALWWSF